MDSDARPVLPRVVAILGLIGLVAMGVVYASSGLVAPGWAVLLLLTLWVALVVLAIRWFRRRPWRVIVLPLIAVLLWVLVITLGERLLGWTA